MSQNIVVNMKFNADTTQAKKQMQDLQNSLKALNQLTTSSNISIPGGLGVDQLQKSQQSIIQLKGALQSAFNVDTGRLDLTNFNQRLKQSNLTVDKLKSDLMALGPRGQQAFTQLAQSIAMADVPMLRISENMRR